MTGEDQKVSGRSGSAMHERWEFLAFGLHGIPDFGGGGHRNVNQRLELKSSIEKEKTMKEETSIKRCGRTKCGKWVFLAILLILSGGIGAGITLLL
jgi:hypothetical protein